MRLDECLATVIEEGSLSAQAGAFYPSRLRANRK